MVSMPARAKRRQAVGKAGFAEEVRGGRGERGAEAIREGRGVKEGAEGVSSGAFGLIMANSA
jgi:hypothetical protein